MVRLETLSCVDTATQLSSLGEGSEKIANYFIKKAEYIKINTTQRFIQMT